VAAKVNFNPTTRRIEVTLAPDANDEISLNVQVDIYSDGKEDWLSNPALNKMRFPIFPIGGNPIPSGVFGDAYILTNGWRIAPYEADHTLHIVGDLFPEVEPLVVDTVGSYRVRVNGVVSSLVKVVETGTSGLTTAESTALLTIDANVTTLDTNVDLLLTAQTLTNQQAAAEKTTDPDTGKLILRNTVVMRRWEADAWEDDDMTVPYKGEGLESVGQLVEVAWS
jgi:hypothetical protein